MADNISNEPVHKVKSSSEVSPISLSSNDAPSVESGVSSIEKSKAVKPDIIPPMDAPMLAAPSVEGEAFVIASLDSTGKPIESIVYSFVLKADAIKHEVLEGWMENLREIQEYVKQLLASPVYQQLQEIQRKGDLHFASVSGVQGVTSANGAEKNEQIELLSSIDRWQALGKVPPSAEVPDHAATSDSSKVLVLPLTAALLAGGGFSMGAGIVHSANPAAEVIEMIGQIQHLFPTVSVQDLVPLINLMVVGPLYFNSWQEATNNLIHRDRKNHLPLIHHFSKDVIKIVADTQFINGLVVKQMKGADNLSSQDQERLTRMIKVVLIGVALGLLYSAEVGKIQENQFGGIEPEELRDVLMGKTLPDEKTKGSEHQQLTVNLVTRGREQLQSLSIEDRVDAVEMLLSYITKSRDLNPMLEPVHVFNETLQSTQFKPRDNFDRTKG